MSVSYRSLKFVLCIQELDPFGYIPLLVSLKPSLISPCVCVRVKIHSILKRKNSGLIPHWKMSVSYRCLKLVLCIQELDPFGYIPVEGQNFTRKPIP